MGSEKGSCGEKKRKWSEREMNGAGEGKQEKCSGLLYFLAGLHSPEQEEVVRPRKGPGRRAAGSGLALEWGGVGQAL